MVAKVIKSLVPKLRFPEFADEGHWEARPLGKLAKRRTQRNAAGSKLRTLTNSAEFGVVDQRDFFEKDIATNTDNYFVVQTGDYVYNPRVSKTAPVGPISKNRLGDGVMSPLYTVFRFKNDEYELFSQFFASSHWHQYLRRVSNSGARHDRMAISNRDLMAMPIPLPPTEKEQQKVAECLGSLDDLITAESQKLDALREHRKGLMQQLLPQPERIERGRKIDAETAPRLRLPEFLNAGEWETMSLGKACDILNNRRVPITRSNRKPGPYPYYGASGIVDYVEDYLFDEELVLVGEDGAKWKAFEDTAFIASGRYWVNNHAHVLKPMRTSAVLLSNYLTMIDLGGFVTGAAPPKLTLAKLKTIPIPCPVDKEEQVSISRIFENLNRKIDHHSEKLEAQKKHKRGLLQQLFPSTGAR